MTFCIFINGVYLTVEERTRLGVTVDTLGEKMPGTDYEVEEFENCEVGYGQDSKGNQSKVIPVYLILSSTSYAITEHQPHEKVDRMITPTIDKVDEFLAYLESKGIPKERYGLYMAYVD